MHPGCQVQRVKRVTGRWNPFIALVEELRRDLPSVNNRGDPLAEFMTEALDVHAVANQVLNQPQKCP